jgi:hypothetical protein
MEWPPLELLIAPLTNENRRENSGKYGLTFIGIGISISGFAIAVPLSTKAEKYSRYFGENPFYHLAKIIYFNLNVTQYLSL